MPAVAALTLPLRQRMRAWFDARSPRSDTFELTQRNVYILPTRAGLMFAATLVVLLVASINYQLNLGYVLTFLLAGSGIVSMHVTHNQLRGLVLHLRPLAPVFAGDTATLELVLASAGAARFGVGVNLAHRPGDEQSAYGGPLCWLDVPAGGQASAQLSFVPVQRGRHALPAIGIETRFPLGLFRAWSVWRPAPTLLVYPQPERPTAPLPPARAAATGASRQRAADSGDVDGVRAYRRGDALKTVVWKKAAKAMQTGGDLISRDASSAAQQELWLDWQACGSALPAEARLSRLTAWVLAADQRAARFGLGLPGRDVALGQGDAHRRATLEALALWA